MRFFALGFFLLVFALLASAISQAEALEAKRLVDAGASCDKLSTEQLELIGEYIMEQMHPSESHDAMHEMMGIKEGSPEEKSFHSNLARAMYCGNGEARGMVRAGSMMGGGMMAGFMRNMIGLSNAPNNYGMMGYAQGTVGWNIVDVLAVLLLIGLVLLVYLHVWKKIKERPAK